MEITVNKDKITVTVEHGKKRTSITFLNIKDFLNFTGHMVHILGDDLFSTIKLQEISDETPYYYSFPLLDYEKYIKDVI